MRAFFLRFIQIAMGLDYIHSKKVLHRDLKVIFLPGSQLTPATTQGTV